MTQREIWTKVAQDSFQHECCCGCRVIVGHGLCYALKQATSDPAEVGVESARMRNHQSKRARATEVRSAYWWPLTPAGNAKRRAFALKMRTAPMTPKKPATTRKPARRAQGRRG